MSRPYLMLRGGISRCFCLGVFSPAVDHMLVKYIPRIDITLPAKLHAAPWYLRGQRCHDRRIPPKIGVHGQNRR